MSYFRLFLVLAVAGAWLPAECHGIHVIVLDEVSEMGRGGCQSNLDVVCRHPLLASYLR